ncbi:MAG: fibronectin type III domain-containing protein [Marinobacter sp.]|uniref:fibronectin type III domain-containing protein n=1 Tax=Marinobacter sp. TaxID=50741 RepID=UPI00299D794C|nr:fibronectin type III domain-containing protein [Marinobacter sp.]MDX1635868.1 fibronectin type III domain-containing protein [Marinobacter sp.]
MKQGLLTITMAALLSGCGLDGDQEASDVSSQAGSAETGVRVTGTAMKGVIQDGLVTANRLLADADGRYQLDRFAAKPVRTGQDGHYQLKLRGNASGWALVELRADTATRMICDVVPRCDQPGTAGVAFGEPLTLASDFVLRGAGDLARETVYLTPLAHLAVALAEREPTGLSPAALASAYQSVEAWFGLAPGALLLAPPDLTRLDELSDVSADALQVAITNAAFLALVNDSSQWSSIAEVLADMAAQVAADGRIDIMGSGTNLALADLVAAAALQAAELQQVVDSSLISQKLVVVEYRNVQRFKTIADVYTVPDTGVELVDSVDTTETPAGTGTEPAPGTGDTSADSADSQTDTTVTAETDGTTTTGDLPATDSTTETFVPADAALLSWTAPLTRENGESLSMGEIAGFEVVYGTSADTLDQSLAIGDASVDQLLVDQLSPGTWYFAIRTLDTDGNRSRLSEVVNKQITL